jgi:hypothetical protein
MERLPLHPDDKAKLRIACDVLSAQNIQAAAALLNVYFSINKLKPK